MTSVSAVVFLGNPGREYERTRHNAGFLLGAMWSPSASAVWSQKFKAEWASISLTGNKFVLLRPQTFMNLVGESVRAAAEYLKIPAQSWLAVHDDIDLPLGEFRLQRGGGLGGHNGLRSIQQHGGTADFHRLRLGIGRPSQGDVASWVLGRFTPEQEISLAQMLDQASRALESYLSSQTT